MTMTESAEVIVPKVDMLNLSVREFLHATGAKQPTPGGGSIAALCGALGANLASMALLYTLGKKAYAAHDAENQKAINEFQMASKLLQELIAEDIAAYGALSPMLKLSPEERAQNPDYLPTVVAAVRAPQTVAGVAMSVLERCATLLDKTNKFLISDLGIAATLAHATVHASEINVRVNLPLLPDSAEAEGLKKSLAALVSKSDYVYASVREYMLRVL